MEAEYGGYLQGRRSSDRRDGRGHYDKGDTRRPQAGGQIRANLVVTCEPTFYSRSDTPTPTPRRGGLQKRLGAKALRVVGDPGARVRRIQLGVGYATPAITSPDVDVVVSGEQQEGDGTLDSPAYVLDAATLGIPKGWIMLGHAVSEEQGMLEMAHWVKVVHARSPRAARARRGTVPGAGLISSFPQNGLRGRDF